MPITAQPFFTPDSAALRFLPEGPRVLHNHPAASGHLGWVAIQHAADAHHGSFNILDLHTKENQQFALPGRPGFFAETITPGLIAIGLERQLVLFNTLTGELTTLAELDCPTTCIINDGLAVDGGILFGTKHLEFNRPIAALYFFNSTTRRIHTVVDQQICSNGKFLHGTTLVDIDSTPKTITTYELDPALETIISRKLLTPPGKLPALPDGMRPTADGESIIVAYYNPAPVPNGLAQQLSLSEGTVLNEWILPGSPRVTCPEFVELDGQIKLIFTTAVEGMPDAPPLAGSLFIADTPFTKLPAPPPLVALT